MRARTCVGAALLLVVGARASGEPKPKPVDVKDRDDLLVLQDAKGGTYVVRRVGSASQTLVFYGKANGPLYQQTVKGGYRDGDVSWSVRVDAPRSTQHFGEISRRPEGDYVRSCAQDDIVGLSEITGEKRKQILARSTLLTTNMIYVPYTFARDELAVYYYVDQIRTDYGGGGYRLFIGKKGAMKPVQLADVSIDTRGAVFSTKQGDLSVTRERDNSSALKPVWIHGDKRLELLWLDTTDNSTIIYRDLGIYGALGTICDDF